MKSPHRAMALRGLHYCAAILIKKVLVDSNVEIPCNGAEIVVCDGLEDFPGGMNKVPYLSSLFNGVISCHSAGSWKNGLQSATSSGFMRYVRLPPLRSCQPCSQKSPKGAVFPPLRDCHSSSFFVRTRRTSGRPPGQAAGWQ